jgi:ankyrin repeat protein
MPQKWAQSCFQFLIDNGLDLTEGSGAELMVSAARMGNVEIVSLLCDYYPINVPVRVWNEHYSVLLLSAVRTISSFGHSRLLIRSQPAGTEIPRFLVEQGADINTCLPSLWSPQHWIDGEQLKWLIDNGLDCSGSSIYSILYCRLQFSGDLNEEGFGMRYFRDEENTGNKQESLILTIMRTLIDQDVPIFSPHESASLWHRRNLTTDIHPLSFFISLKPGREIILRVLDTGIDVNGTGYTPLQAAARAGDLDSAKELILRGASINSVDHQYAKSPLNLACGLGGAASLLEGSNWIHDTSSINRQYVHPEIAELFLENGADPNDVGNNIESKILPLQVALRSKDNDLQLTELPLKYGADANALIPSQDENEDDALPSWKMGHPLKIVLIRQDNPGSRKRRLIELLLNHGANINARYNRTHDPSPLEVACQHGGSDCLELVSLLLDHGAELEPPVGYEDKNALAIACKRKNINLIKLLLHKGIDPDPRSPSSPSPLAVAATEGDLEIALLLLAANASVSAPTTSWLDCPLVAAAKNGRLDMVMLLLSFETRKEAFEVAISSAERAGFNIVASSIRQYVAQQSLLPPHGERGMHSWQ